MNLLNTMTYETVDLGLPKFDFSYGFRLSEIATEIDSEFLFDDGMFENLSPGIAMGDLFQETRIVMNESGVSSATDPIRTDVPPEGARSLILNRPMLFVIIDKNIDGVRTIGRVVTP